MTLDQQKEQLSVAYVHAVASAACCAMKDVRIDDDSVDVTIVSRIRGTVLHSPELNLQLKTTAQDILDDTDVVYPLKIKNYDDLRDTKMMVPRLLVVLVVPPAPSDWLKQVEHKTHLYRCAYWTSLHGMDSTTNTSTISVRVPRRNIFTPAALGSIMSTISNGGRP